MQRPILNPSIFDDPDRLPDAPTRDTQGTLVGLAKRLFLAWPRPVLAATVRLLLTPVHPIRRTDKDDADLERPSWLARYAAPVIFRLMFLILLLLGTVVVVVHLMTHRIAVAGLNDAPTCAGVLAELVHLQAADGASLRAWHAHAIDAQRVMQHKDVAARAKWPAVVLVADQRGDGHDLDRLIRPLHDSGCVVLVLQLRGASGETAQTFGLLEQQDVTAAVANLRSRSYVDRERISIIATGTGATAALLARKQDSGIDRVIAYRPIGSFDEILADSVNASWLRPACRWAFEASQQVDVEDLSAVALARDIGVDAIIIHHAPPRSADMDSVLAMLHQAQNTLAATER